MFLTVDLRERDVESLVPKLWLSMPHLKGCMFYTDQQVDVRGWDFVGQVTKKELFAEIV